MIMYELLKDYVYIVVNDNGKKYINVRLQYVSGKKYSEVIWLNEYMYNKLIDSCIAQCIKVVNVV